MKKRILIILIIITLLIALFAHLGDSYFRGEEQRRAVVSIEAFKSGEMIVPHLLDMTYFNKPPLFNWVLVGFYHLTGSIHEWVVRLPGVLSLLLTGFILFLVVKGYINEEAALLASLAYLTFSDLLFFAAVYSAEIDLFYSLLVFLQIILFFHFHARKKYLLMFLFSYALTAFGLLTKGMPSIAFQGITVLVILIYYREWKVLFGWKHLTGILMFFLIAGGYFYLFSMKGNAEAYMLNLFKEASQRSASEHGIWEILLHIILFPFLVLKLLLPWAVLVVFLFRKSFLKIIKGNKLVLFSSLFIVTNIILYWISPEIRNRYIYMFLPFIIIILVYFFTCFEKKDQFLSKWLFKFFGIAIFLMAIFFIVIPLIETISNDVKHAWIKGIIFAILFFLIFWQYLKQKELRIYLFILALIISRIGFNFSVLPHLNNNYKSADYVKYADRILDITGKNEIYYIVNPWEIDRDLTIAGIKISEATYEEPPSIPYQVPYYLVKSSGKIMKLSYKPVPGAYCLSEKFIAENFDITVFLEYTDPHVPMEMVLFKVEE